MQLGTLGTGWMDYIDSKELAEWIATAQNTQVTDVHIDSYGRVFDGQKWLEQEELEELCAKIEAGV